MEAEILRIACGPAPDGRARPAVVAATTVAIGEGAAPIPFYDCALISSTKVDSG